MKQRLAPDAVEGELSLRRYAVAGLVASLAVVIGAVTGGQPFVSHLPGAWLFGTPGGPLDFLTSSSATTPAASVLAVYGGLGALAAVWWRLLRALRQRPGVRVAQVVRVIAVWSVPFILAPPLFSRDVYAYAGQGALVSFGINPYHYGPGVLGVSRFNLLAGPVWANTPSPYGPTFLSLDGFMTQLTGHNVLADVLLLRFLSVAGVALLVAGLPVLARYVGRDPATAVVFGAGSPLVLASLVGGAHNDALMVGLLVAGLAAWQRFGPIPGIVLCALAAGVKAPAVLGIVAIGWNWGPSERGIVRRIVRTVEALGIGAATLAAISAVSGVGWGWVFSLTVPDKVSTGVTPVDALAHVIAGALHAVGSTMPIASVRTVTSGAGVAVAAVVGAWLLWRSPRMGVLKALGLALLLLALLNPVLWAWYLVWGLAVLAPVATGRLRRGLTWLIVLETMVGVASVSGMVRTLGREGALADVMIVVGIAAAVLGALSGPYEPLASRARRAPPAVTPVPAASRQPT